MTPEQVLEELQKHDGTMEFHIQYRNPADVTTLKSIEALVAKGLVQMSDKVPLIGGVVFNLALWR